MALFHTTVLDNQIKALPTVDTASGSVATFDTDMTENLVEVLCNITPVQTGSGTPSPSNPRPITVYTSLNLSHSGADTSNPTVYNIPFGQTVANGVLDVTTGKLRVTWGYVDLGSLNWNYESGNVRFYATINNIKPSTQNFICSQYVYGYTVTTDKTMQIASTYVYIKDTAYTDATTFKTAMSGVQLVYELVTPQEIQLDSTQITALLNENNIWCDTGDTSVKYILSVGKAIS